MVDQNFMKRMAPFLVLEILKNHTDDTHGLKLTQVVEFLEEDYGVTMERKAVSRILNDLYELTEISQAYSWKHPMPYTIDFDTRPRSTGDIRENWRVYKNFEDVEVRLLSDAVQAVRGYPTGRVLNKLRQLGSISMRNTLCRIPVASHGNTLMPSTMDQIERAIRREKKLTFGYAGVKEQLVVSPYKMVLRNGIYYLVCYDERKGDMAIFLIECMSNAAMQDSPAKDYHMVKDASRWQYDLECYLDDFLSNTIIK